MCSVSNHFRTLGLRQLGVELFASFVEKHGALIATFRNFSLEKARKWLGLEVQDSMFSVGGLGAYALGFSFGVLDLLCT